VTDTANPSPDWYPDPTGRFEQRYWDGSQWTEHVSSAGQQRSDPLPGSEPAAEAASDLPGLGDFADLSTESVEPDTPVEPAAAVASAFADVAPAPEPTPTASPAAPVPAAEWYPDPTRRYEQRYWDGADWTEHVTAAGQQGIDPLPDAGSADLSAGAESSEATESVAAASEVLNPFASSADSAAEQPSDPATPEAGEATADAETVIDPVVAGPDATQPSVAQPVIDPSGGPAADWYPDPSGRHGQRYWDGAQWTEHASSGGQQVVDPLG
jgi:hypothetical protein